MTRVRVKICGITRPEDAELASELGAAALGFVFWPPSPRAVTIEVARAIGRRVPSFVTRVGVFVDARPDDVREAARHVPLDVAQLHGDETPSAHRNAGVRLIKAVTLESDADVARVGELPPDVMPLVDAADAVRRGGTGRAADWTLARALSSRRQVVLAGGLTPDNVGDAIAAVRPWAVDVASGVEDRPGVKDPARLAAFLAAVSAAEIGEGEDQ